MNCSKVFLKVFPIGPRCPHRVHIVLKLFGMPELTSVAQ